MDRLEVTHACRCMSSLLLMLVLVSFGDVSMSVDASKRVPEVARTHADTPTYNLLASDRGQLSLYTAFSVITTGRRILTVGALQGGGCLPNDIDISITLLCTIMFTYLLLSFNDVITSSIFSCFLLLQVPLAIEKNEDHRSI